MAVKTEKDLPEPHRSTWLKALSATQLRNYGYAVQLLQTVLKTHPDFLAGRQLLRKAALAKNAGKKSMLSGLSSASFSTMKAQGLIKKDPVAAMDAVEKILESEPYSPQANMLLRDAALAANLPEVAAFALETIIEGNQKDTKTMHELAKHYVQFGQPDKAVEVYTAINVIIPNDLTAVKGGKDAAAANSMLRGGWEREDTTYRDLIKNKEEAISLEQQGRVVRSEDMIEHLLVDLHAAAEADPTSVDNSRKIAELYNQKGDLASAEQWYTYAASLTGNSDLAMLRKAADLRIKQFDMAIAARQEILEATPDVPEAAQYLEEIESFVIQRAELLLSDARGRVEGNPTDLQARFELGENLVTAHKYQEAIPELQKARNNPNVRIRSMGLLGQCFMARTMYDLAAQTLSEAAAELPAMDATKKDIIYTLGLVYEKMSRLDDSITQMKLIYSVDYGYRDVAARVEGSYAGS